jgi:hypothetical protein
LGIEGNRGLFDARGFAGAGKDSRVLVINEDLFFIYLLPTIIFDAGMDFMQLMF